ncbi:MAG: PEGA domain-containing protein [Chitinispirillaceae bacterium]|nr:PEGA domain-containing protein [Chitinispirillaceae bacterium]
MLFTPGVRRYRQLPVAIVNGGDRQLSYFYRPIICASPIGISWRSGSNLCYNGTNHLPLRKFCIIMRHHQVMTRSHRYAMILCIMAALPVLGQIPTELLLLGCIRNETTYQEYDGIHLILDRQLVDIPRFPRIILDTAAYIDSFPDEVSLLKAREMNAAYMMWGVIDSSEPGPGITIDILDMGQGSVSQIRLSIGRNEGSEAIAGMVRSKLQLWLQRTTMVQLIVTTLPTAAAVLLDDMMIGSTPFEGMVEPGTYRLELKKKTYPSIQIPVSFISGNTYHYDFALNTGEKKVDKRSIVKWLGVSVACFCAGGVAHWQRSRVQEHYRGATPPADFDRLYNRAVAWDVGRDILFAAGGAAFGVVIVKVVIR